jgi:hypothetical protein
MIIIPDNNDLDSINFLTSAPFLRVGLGGTHEHCQLTLQVYVSSDA